ncbi:zinc finger MYM-type protein 1-like [Diprion similis]|uniref:zinc finger MYM-type protein 1-like n=1 Tax=Diprion similis TaxID=362088 RepID=UPI001EF91A54|nr:zinc finger MYM-type protein 1-like [Diprion similis]
MAGSMMKFLSKPENKDCQEIIETVTASSSAAGSMEESEEKKICCSPNPLETDTESEISEDIPEESISGTSSSAVSISLTFSNDPGSWPASINSDLVDILVRRGPVQMRNHSFPVNDNGRKFSEYYYHRHLPNGEEINRDWLIYSISKDSVYCFCCKIFGKTASSLSDLNGFSNWQHLSLNLKRHETSDFHNENVKSWVQLNNMMKTKTTVNQMQLRLLESERKHWCDVLEIAVVKFLSRQCLAFRGSSKKIFEHDNGNFLKAIEMIASFDSTMREHIRRIELKSDSSRLGMAHYLGDQIQNEIIEILGTAIKNYILDKESLRKSKYFSVILDCTPDASYTEQITVILRHVCLNNTNKKVEVCENFIGFCPITSSTGEGLLNFVLNLFSQLNLDIQHLRGQGYDNGANMRGKHNGLHKKILEINSRAFYVPCSAHSLNLVVNDAANITHETTNFFDIVQEIYVFFSVSTKRWSIICKHIPDLKLKPLSATRWSSRIDAIKPLRYHIEKIFDALFEISENMSDKEGHVTVPPQPGSKKLYFVVHTKV